MNLETKVQQLEQELQKLKDIEDIKKLMGKYFRCLDSKLWDEIYECFTADVTTSYSDGKLSFQGADDVVGFFRKSLSKTQITMHQGHTPEINITSNTTSTARWYLQDYLILTNRQIDIKGAAFYSIKYEKIDGNWKIKKIGYNRTFEERRNRKDPKDCTITENMFESN